MSDVNYTRLNQSQPNTEHSSLLSGNTDQKDVPIKSYFIKALLYIKRILEFLVKLKPMVEQYGPLVKELPKLYKMMRLMQNENQSEQQEVRDSEDSFEETEEHYISQEHESEVKLFI